MPRTARHVGLALSLSLLLFGCGTAPNSAPTAEAPGDPYANGQQYPWEYHGGTGVRAQSLTPGVNTLQYEPVLYASNGWGPVEKNRSNGEQAAGDGKALTLNGKTYTQGYGVHANSEMKFSLKGSGPGVRCTRLTLDVGVDDEVGGKGSVVFQVWLDDGQNAVKAFDSGVMTGASATKRVDLDITGKTQVYLYVQDAGDGISYDHADWADPKLYCEPVPAAGPGLDASFGTGGIVTTYVGDRNGAVAESGAVDARGRLVVVGSAGKASQSSDYAFRVVRYAPDGTLDSSFGQGGIATTHFPPVNPAANASDDLARDVILDTQGRILVVGTAQQENIIYFDAGQYTDFALARYNADGTLDTSFGQGGLVETDIRGYRDEINAVTLDAQGRILVAGFTGSGADERSYTQDFAVARYNANGTLDPTFGTGGKVITKFSEGNSAAINLFTDAQGGILVVGGAGGRLAMARYTPNGTPDTSFGPGGRVTSSVSSYVTDAAMDAQGRIVVVGASSGDPQVSGSTDFMLARFNANGTPDTTFGTGGRTVTDFGGRDDAANGVAIDAWGRIAVTGGTVAQAGYNNSNFAVARYTPSGTLDPTFGQGGRSSTDVAATTGSTDDSSGSTYDAAAGVVIDPQGRIIALGGTNSVFSPATNYGAHLFALTRYLP